jgi:hypothetical protein
MDFRSQLSAFQNNGGSSSNSPNNNRGYNTGQSNNSNNNNNYYGRGGSDQRHGRGDGSGDRRRHRPNNWSHQGPPQTRRRYHSPDRDGLGELRRFGFNIPKGSQPLPTPEEKKKKAKHIVLLAITIDDLPYEHIWKDWLQTISPEAEQKDDFFVSLVCHAKFPDQVKSEWLRQRLLVQKPRLGRGNSYLDPEFLTRKPDWGSVEITRAMLDLLEDAVKIGNEDQKDMRFAASRYLVRRPAVPIEDDTDETIPPVDQFLFISETCLPVCTAQEVFEKVKDTTVSWVNARHRNAEGTPQNKYEDDQFAGISRRIPGQFRWKADQWLLLSRNHALQILTMDRPHIHPRHQLWQNFRNINASDEMYFPTTLALLGLLRYAADGEDTQKARSSSDGDETARSGSISHDRDELNAPEPVHLVLKTPVTYTDWTEGMRNPASFTKGIADFRRIARLARNQGCLVARKFAPFIAVPGVAKEDQKVTGHITAEEWRQEVELMKTKDEKTNPKPSAEDDDDENQEKQSEDADKSASKVNDVQKESTSEDKEREVEAAGKAEEEDDDDDQQENELE